MIKNLNRYKKHITQDNGELRYRGCLILAERTISVSEPRISNIVIDYAAKEGYEGTVLKELEAIKESSHRWMVHFEEGRPVYYEAYAHPIEEIFDDIDHYHRQQKTPPK